MRIDKLEIKNFKKFADQTIELHPQFNLLVGDNCSGKSSILDALAVALGIWMVDRPEQALKKSRRKISDNNVRLVSYKRGDRLQFEESYPVVLRATGQILDKEGLVWTRQRDEESSKTSQEDAKDVLALIRSCFMRSKQGEEFLCPVLAYYGAQRGSDSIQFDPKQMAIDYLVRAANGSRKTMSRSGHTRPGLASRWAAFYRCLHPEINFTRTFQWFLNETLEAGSRQGRPRSGFEVVRRAILRCMPGSDAVFYSADLDQIVLSFNKQPQPWHNLSAGQRTMMTFVADLAIKAVTQNAHLVPEDELGSEDELPLVLSKTPGVVLIDELDIHLHPSWQRRVVADLRATFPSIQFVCTSHSPQVIGELSRDEVLLLRNDAYSHPAVARGADSNWILDHVLDRAASKNETAKALHREAEEALASRDFEHSRAALTALRDFMEDGETGELVGLESRLESLETLASEEGSAGA